MITCKQCGHQMEKSKLFCKECGTKLQEASDVKGVKQSSKITTFLSGKRNKWIVGSLVVVMIVFFGLFKWADVLTDKENLIEKLRVAIAEEDVAFITSHVIASDDSIEVTEKNAQDFIEHFSERDLEFELFQSLYEQSAFFDQFPKSKNALYGLSQLDRGEGLYNLVALEKVGKSFLLFDQYKFVMEPVSLMVDVNYSDVTLYVEEQEVKGKEEEGYLTLGVFFPGTYQVKASLDTGIVAVDREIEANLYQTYYHDLTFELDDVTFYSNMENATIYLNDDELDLKGTSEGVTYGPILLDGSVEVRLEKETEIGLLVSPVQKIENNVVHATLLPNDEEMQEIMEMVNQYILDYNKALMSRDPDSIPSNITISMKESMEYEIEQLKSWNEFFIGYLTKTSFDVNDMYLEEEDGQWHLELPVYIELEADYMYAGETPELTKETEANVFSLIYDEEKESWIISDMYSSYAEFTRVKEFEFNKEDQEEDMNLVEKAMQNQVKEEEFAESVSEIEQLMQNYNSSSVTAINRNDYSIIATYIDPKGEALQKEMKDYIKYLDSKQITEQWVYTEVKDVQEEDGMYIVKTEEQYTIYYGESNTAKRKTFDSEYQVSQSGEALKVHKLVSTTETDSYDVY